MRIDFFKEGETPAYGVTNRCQDGKFVLFLDYDNIPYEWMREELLDLQLIYRLSTIYIFETDKGFHAMCLDKFTLPYLLKIMENTSIDPKYKDIPLKYGKRLWTLRLSEKKKPIRLINILENNCIRSQSSSHAKLLEVWYDMKIKLDIPDNQKQFIAASYKC